MYSLRVTEIGMREPHWHPVTAEMGYVEKGHARMRVLDPDNSLDEYLLGPGDVYFVPRAFPHHIEVLGEDDIHFLIFFDQPMPGDIVYFRHSHVGIVVAARGDTLLTIEGNASDAVRQRLYPGWRRISDIDGFGRP